MIDAILTTGDISRRFRVSRSTLCKLRKKKAGPDYHTVGRQARYYLKDVEAWIEGNTTRHLAGKVVA